MTYSVKNPCRTLAVLFVSFFLTIAVMLPFNTVALADDYDVDTVDVIDVQPTPWGAPPQGSTVDALSEKGASSPTDFLSESDYQTQKRTLSELNQVLKTIYDRNPSYLSQLAMFKVSSATRLYNAFVYNRGAFIMGTGFWNSLQTQDARAFMILSAITWKKNHGADKAQRTSVHSRIGVFPAGLPLLLLTSGLSLPYNGWASYQAYKAYPSFVYKTDKMTLDELKKLKYDPVKAIEALNVLVDTDAFSFLDQPAQTYYEAQTGRSVYNPLNYRLAKQGFIISVPKPEKRYKKLTAYLAKQTTVSTPSAKKP
jgi:hypothetical protein